MLPKNLFKKPKNDLESYDKYTKSPAPDIPSELCISCPECKAMLFTSELNENLDVCPKCGSHNLTKIDRMNGYLSYSRVHGDTRLNAAKMAEIAERKSM